MSPKVSSNFCCLPVFTLLSLSIFFWMSIFPSWLAKQFSGWPKLWLHQNLATKKLNTRDFSFEGLTWAECLVIQKERKKYQHWGMHRQGEEKQRSRERRTALLSESVMWVPELCSPAGVKRCFKVKSSTTWHVKAPMFIHLELFRNVSTVRTRFGSWFGEVSFFFPPMLTVQG